MITSRHALSCLLALALVAAGAGACRIERDRPAGDTFHPEGFADDASPEFHGASLKRDGYPLADCRACHGEDYRGGSVGSACTSSGCHTEEKGPESCGTCHATPPESDAHPKHVKSCDPCHSPHLDARGPDHPNGRIELRFSGLAIANDAKPVFDAKERTCRAVYCHGGAEVAWRGDLTLGCDSCHSDPPASHGRFADASSDCASCHGGEAVHGDGKLDLADLGCASCHGAGPLGAPGPGLLESPDGPGVGAHARHLDSTLGDRIGRVARCQDCHVVPATIDAPGHVDSAAPADVTLFDGSYDASERRCTTGCHWDRDPGPRWTDDSGAARACDGCHAMPPATTRVGGPHPPSAPDLAVCVGCHAFDPATHVDGTVDFNSGANAAPASPPPDAL